MAIASLGAGCVSSGLCNNNSAIQKQLLDQARAIATFAKSDAGRKDDPADVTPDEIASTRGGQLLRDARGAARGSERSGQGGKPYIEAGQQLQREGKAIGSNTPIGKAYVNKGKQWVNRGRDINHQYRR
jgi:hypothetical protein